MLDTTNSAIEYSPYAPDTDARIDAAPQDSGRRNALPELVFIIDRDVKRRAATSYYLNSQGIFAEPFETVDEFVGRWPKTGVVLVHDDETEVALLMREIGRRQTWLPVLAYSQNPEPQRIVRAVMDGVVGFAGWPGCGQTLIQIIRNTGNRYQAANAPNSRKMLARGMIEKLSKREREILAGMVEGLSNRQIGTHFSISPRTVELHRANLLAKIGVRRSAEAIRLAIEASLPALLEMN